MLVVNTIAKLSGVVTSMCGAFFAILALSLVEVSPVLNPTLISCISIPFLSANPLISSKGLIKLT